MLMTIVWGVSIGVVGAAFGSWLATIERAPRRFWQRSICAVGGEHLSARDLVPVIGWLNLRGRCRRCSTRISWHYPVFEVAAAGLFWWAWYRLGAPIEASELWWSVLAEWFLVAVAIRVARQDMATGEIPLILVGAAAGLWLVWVLVQGNSWANSVAGASVGAGFFLWQYVLSRGRWVGGGDVWFGWLMGMVLGWPLVLVALGLGYILGAAFSVVLVAAKKWGRNQTVPLAPFLALALLVTHWWGNFIIAFLQSTK